MTSADSVNNLGHYDEKYFEWQKKTGRFTALANQIKFREFTSPDLKVLDFGCGGGFMLQGLPAREKMGVEVNPWARKQAIENGLRAVPTIDEVPDGWADLLISDHALEHTPRPLDDLVKLRTKLRPGGRAVFVIPCEHLDMPFDPNDHNQHLYSWGPQSLGNLFKLAGFEVQSSLPFFHKHFFACHKVRPVVGAKVFDALCYLNGRINHRRSNEVRVIATA